MILSQIPVALIILLERVNSRREFTAQLMHTLIRQ